MRALSECIYAVSYLEWAVLGDLGRLTEPHRGLSVAELSRSTMGGVGSVVRNAAKQSTQSQRNGPGSVLLPMPAKTLWTEGMRFGIPIRQPSMAFKCCFDGR
jgi:hypothetical protein